MSFLFLSTCAIAMSLAMTPTFGNASDPCGVITLGSFKVDVAARAESTVIPKSALIENFQAGIAFSGTDKCPGNYTVTGLTLRIESEEQLSVEYDLDFVRKMQSMERYMLARYFNKARKLVISNVAVKNAAGKEMQLPSVTFVIRTEEQD